MQTKGYLGPKNMNYVAKEWGYELWITNNEKYCGKILFIKKGKQCSWHYHVVKDEVLFVKSGELLFRVLDKEAGTEEEEVLLGAGEAWHVRPGVIHQMTALEDVEIFEISTQHFDEDSYRLEKGKNEYEPT